MQALVFRDGALSGDPDPLSAPVRSRVFVAAPALGLVTALLGWFDVVTGPEYGFSLVYIAPIVTGGWYYGRRIGAVLAVEAAFCWILADLSTTHHSLPANVWNGFTRLAIYLGVGIGAAAMAADRERLRVLLQHELEHARTDALTGLENGRAFRDNAARDLARARRDQVHVTLVYLDIDNFKWVNDRHGHHTGDAVLAQIAQLLRATLREGDRAARLGGDEFALLLWGADAQAAGRVAARVIDGVKELGLTFPGSRLGASAGLASAEPGREAVGDLLQAADHAMYQVKRSGKGLALVSIPPPTAPRP
jgi:diguanylate cyclase (GGDEF)-like protein